MCQDPKKKDQKREQKVTKTKQGAGPQETGQNTTRLINGGEGPALKEGVICCFNFRCRYRRRATTRPLCKEDWGPAKGI